MIELLAKQVAERFQQASPEAQAGVQAALAEWAQLKAAAALRPLSAADKERLAGLDRIVKQTGCDVGKRLAGDCLNEIAQRLLRGTPR